VAACDASAYGCMAVLFFRLYSAPESTTAPTATKGANATAPNKRDGWGGVPPPRVALGNQSHGPSPHTPGLASLVVS
jgi:hypothetical protein